MPAAPSSPAADPVAKRGIYLPEIHDLGAHCPEQVDDLVAEFPIVARPCLALSIVPDWQGRWPLDRHQSAAARLAALPGTPVLHGLTHSLGQDWWNRLLYGHDNRSEFRSLDATEAAARLDRGRALFEAALGVTPRWFCAPRWQGGRHLPGLLARRGFEGWLGLRAIHRCDGSAIALPALNFDEGERRWRQSLGLALRRGNIARLLRGRRPFRLVLHPDDLRRPAVMRQFRALVALLDAEGWEPVSLAALGAAGHAP